MCSMPNMGKDNQVERDLRRYIDYLSSCEGIDVTADTVDYEHFLGFPGH